MGGFIILADGRAYAPANWAFDAAIDAISRVLGDTAEDLALRTWLAHQTCRERGSGLGRVDVRELVPNVAQGFVAAIPRAFAAERAGGGHRWHDSSWFPEWLEHFHDLVAMIESIDRGEPPEAFNPHMRSPLPNRYDTVSGPGWPEWLRSTSAEDLAPLATWIERVDWSDTGITDEDLAVIPRLESADEILIDRTQVTAAGLPYLMALEKLDRLWALGTGLSEEALAPLREKFPDAEIHGEGWTRNSDSQ